METAKEGGVPTAAKVDGRRVKVDVSDDGLATVEVPASASGTARVDFEW